MTIRHVFHTAVAGGMTTALLACGDQETGEGMESSSTEAAVIISAPANDATIEGNVRLVLETRGVEVRAAGMNEPGTGHHHLFIDRDITPIGEPIPTEDGVIHLGQAQTEYVLENLAPGEHTIIAVMGDYLHVRLGNVATDTVRVTVSGT